LWIGQLHILWQLFVKISLLDICTLIKKDILRENIPPSEILNIMPMQLIKLSCISFRVAKKFNLNDVQYHEFYYIITCCANILALCIQNFGMCNHDQGIW